jgi:ribosomal protein S18 acetylase RimI-like enzyme
MDTRIASTPDDFAAVARLQADFNTEYDEPAPEPGWLAGHLAWLSAQGDTRVVMVGDPPAGHGIVRLRTQTLVDEREAYIAELYVVPDRRGEGLGTLLLQAIIDDVRALGATYIDLNTTQADVSAVALYEKFGFDCHEGRGSGPLAVYYEKEL